MADEGWVSIADLNREPEASPTWGDYGRSAASGALTLGSNVSALGRQMFEAGRDDEGSAAWKTLQEAFSDSAEDVQKGMSEAGQKRLSAAVTSPEFWEAP